MYERRGTSEQVLKRVTNYRKVIGAALAAMLVGSLLFQRTLASIGMPEPDELLIIAIQRHFASRTTTQCGSFTWQHVLVEYVPGHLIAADSDDELARALRAAQSVALRTGDSVLVLRRTTPVISQYMPITRSNNVKFMRTTAGEWSRLPPYWPAPRSGC